MVGSQSCNTIRTTAGQIFRPLIDLIYPPRCPLCGEGTADQGGLCAPCWGQLVIPGEPCCSSCARPFPSEMSMEQGAKCAVCLADRPKHSGIYAATIYNDASRRLILSFKHGGRIALARQLGELMSARMPVPTDDGNLPLLVPVPLHRWRLWRRGYNQSALLVAELAKLNKGLALVDGLQRTKHTPMLGGMRRKARERALAGAIRVNSARSAKIRGKDIILVDDVLTSGTTSDVCIKALKSAGAGSVSIACFSRVLDEALHGDGTTSREPKR